MSAPTTPRTWALVVPERPGPETTAVHLVGTDEVWVRTGHPESSREWMLTGATIWRTYESWERLLTRGEVQDFTPEWKARMAARLERELALVAGTQAGDAA